MNLWMACVDACHKGLGGHAGHQVIKNDDIGLELSHNRYSALVADGQMTHAIAALFEKKTQEIRDIDVVFQHEDLDKAKVFGIRAHSPCLVFINLPERTTQRKSTTRRWKYC